MKRRSLAVVLSMALALLLGVSSLAGYTVAWFTDSVTSLNSIQSGTLNVEMNYRLPSEADWKRVELNTPLFDQQNLHVPGCVQVVFLQAENAGALALKYQLGLTAANTVVGENVSGEEIRLTDYLEAGAWLLNEETGLTEADFASREAALAMIEAATLAGTMYQLKDFAAPEFAAAASAEKAAVLLSDRDLEAAPAEPVPPEKNTETIALVLHLPIDVDNVANYRGAERPQVAIGVHLLAGQAMVEMDAFDQTYDQDSIYPEYKDPLQLQAAADQLTVDAPQMP